MSQPVTGYTFIAIGKTGVGKSSTCNMIVGETKFLECDSGTSVTSTPQLAQSNYLGHQVTVMDTPGVMDTSVNSHEARKKSCDEMIEAMSRCPAQGKRALVLVLKFGDRYTEESRESLYILKNIFGEEFLEKCCIVVMTHGELFDMNYERENLNFEEWCKRQGGDLKKLFETCGNRCLLFRNRSRDPDVRRQQTEDLIKLTDTLDESYTDEKFAIAERRHKRLILESKLPSVLANYDLRLSKLHREVNSRIVQDQSLNELLSLEHRTKQIVTELEDEDKEIFYAEGESSLFNMQNSRAEDIRKQIHSQLIVKLKLELTTRLTDFKFKVGICESESNVDRCKEEMNGFLERYAPMGLIFRENEISVTEENLLSLQREDLQHFAGVNDLLHQLEDVVGNKRQELGLKRQRSEIEEKIREWKRSLNSIQSSETNSERAEKIKMEAEVLLGSISDRVQLNILAQQVRDVVEKAGDKIKECNINKRNFYIDTGIALASGALGVIGGAASASKHVVAKVVAKAAPAVISFLKPVGGLVKNASRGDSEK